MTTDITKDAGYKGVFPSSFLYGCASASYQIEGGWNAEGKGEGVWDRALKDAADNGEDACDSYHLWQDDIKLLKQYGCNTYRFSISWPRVRPQGGASDPVNEAGIKYYSDLIDALIAEGVTPCVTIFHWDHPQALEDEYGSFSNTERIVKDFVAYAELLFQRFGDRVKNWITINEPHIFTMLSSFVFRAGKWKGTEDTAKLAKTLLLCHGRTVELYRSKYQPEQKGKIAITLNVDWVEPIDDSKEAKDAAQLNLDWVVGLYADPVYLGRFPQVCLDSSEAAPHLTFTENEWAAVKGSSDFFGLNHYGSAYTTGEMVDPKTAEGPRALAFGPAVKVTEKDGKPIGNKGHNGHPFDVPWGFRKLLQYLHKRYTSPSVNGIPITITENGFATQDEANLSLEERINDVQRQTYYRGYLKELIEAQRDDGIEIGGYMAWSLLDNLEWSFGYAPRFGVTIVDRENGFKRTPKDSAYVLRDIFAHAIKA